MSRAELRHPHRPDRPAAYKAEPTPQEVRCIDPGSVRSRAYVRPLVPGWDARGVLMKPVECEECQRTFYTSRPDKARFCSGRCRDHAYDKPGRRGHTLRAAERHRMRHADLGRVCKWCLSTDRETPFANVHGLECGACQRTRYRGHECSRCNGPRGSHGFCGRCDSTCPAHLVELAWIDEATERERRMFILRTAQALSFGVNDVAVVNSIADENRRIPILSDAQKHDALKSGFMALVVPTPMWLRRRI